MRLNVLTILLPLSIAACGGDSAAPDQTPLAPSATEQQTQRTASADPLPAQQAAAKLVVDVPKLAGKSEAEVAALLGDPTSCETVKQGKKCTYTTGETDVVFISGKADWISVDALDSAPYSSDALPLIGFEPATPDFSNEHVMRWRNLPGVLEVSLAPAGGGVDFAYIKISTQ